MQFKRGKCIKDSNAMLTWKWRGKGVENFILKIVFYFTYFSVDRDKMTFPSRWSPRSWTIWPGRRPSPVWVMNVCPTNFAPSIVTSSSVSDVMNDLIISPLKLDLLWLFYHSISFYEFIYSYPTLTLYTLQTDNFYFLTIQLIVM